MGFIFNLISPFFAKRLSLGVCGLCGGQILKKAMVTQSQFRNYYPIKSILQHGKVLFISNRILVRLVYKCFWAGLNQFIPLGLAVLFWM